MTDHKAKMAPRAGSPPGLETDGRGNVIPLARRTEDDRAKARGDGAYQDAGKNPERQAQEPAPMPRAQQGEGGILPDLDQAGQQGGVH
jgi:hypothetical protein